jgi:integrase
VKCVRAWESYLKVKQWSSEYESVDKYLNHFKRKTRSEGTKELACDVLMRFSKYARKAPDELVKLSTPQASKLVQGYVDSLADRGHSIRTVNVTLTFLRTFFRLNGFKADRQIDVERFFQPSRYRKESEYIPTADEVYRMAYSAGSAKNKAMVLCLYTSGLRNSTLRALRFKDVSEELKTREAVKVPVYADMKQVDPRACKGNIPYYSFFSKEAVNALREYLDERFKESGKIAYEEPLFASTSTNVPSEVRRSTPVKRNTLDLVVRRSARRSGITRWKEVHPHCLRKAFESAMRNAGLDPKDQEFLMGHILPGTQDTYYDSTKTEYLREKYRRIEFFPRESGSTEELRKKQILDMVKVLGFSDDKIKRVEEALAKYENADEAMEEIRKLSLSIGGRDRKNGDSDDANGRDRRRSYIIIKGERQLVDSLNDGWNLVKELPEDKFILKRDHEAL